MAEKITILDSRNVRFVPGIYLFSDYDKRAARMLGYYVYSSFSKALEAWTLFRGRDGLRRRDLAFNRISQLAAEMKERGC